MFTVVQEDGAPAIRISGEVRGALITLNDYSNYHLHAQFKWGTRRWPWAHGPVRGGGILYHSMEPADPITGGMRGFACQIQEQDCGDFYAFRGAIGFAETRRLDATPTLRHELQLWTERNGGRGVAYGYWPGGPVVRIDKDPLIKSADGEKPVGQWNTLDLYCGGDRTTHVINGITNMVVMNLRQFDEASGLAPLTHGKIQLQSLGAEIFFRNVELSPLNLETNALPVAPTTNGPPNHVKNGKGAAKTKR